MQRRTAKANFLTINISPTQKKQILWGGRKKLRPMELFRIKQFNDLVKQGLVSGLKFNSDGRLIGAEKTSPNLTEDQIKAIQRVVSITARKEYIGETQQESKIANINRKWTIFMMNHARRGQFQLIHPIMEIAILKGEDTEALIGLAEAQNRKAFPELRNVAAEFNTPQKIAKNLARQLGYFESYMKKRKIKEMTIFEEASMLDATITKIKLAKEGVIRETCCKTMEKQKIKGVPWMPQIESVIKVTLTPNGKIKVQEMERNLG